MADGVVRRIFQAVFGKKIAGTRIFPITTKIIIIFTLFMIGSNITTNYINLVFSREEMSKLLKELLVKDLRELYSYLNNQHEIYRFSNDLKQVVGQIEEKSRRDFSKASSLAIGIKTDGTIFFAATGSTNTDSRESKADSAAVAEMTRSLNKGKMDGFVRLHHGGAEYYTVYRYHPKWDAFLVRGEEYGEFFAQSERIFVNVAIISLLITLACALIGIMLLRFILRFLHRITTDIIAMTGQQQLGLVNLQGASNDDITFLGTAFNSLSSTINSMITIFKKFVNQDVVAQAYREKVVRLEGSTRDLTCLFSDIKRFTFITETLGQDIITLLNLHYGNAIREIMRHDGIIGSIIGDALLSVYGVLDESNDNKSLQSLRSAWAIQSEAALLRERMTEIKRNVEKQQGRLSDAEERVYQAVLIEVGVGIDGGMVFYGNIGSNERMTNTVIGDNVNSASRLEGLTRVYHVPVICSEYVKNDVEANVPGHGYIFVELDTVQVKGKT
ncbi:MAG TPA: adenylate/guanylate cyclase domain-containing protein, partial [Spirochaetota bacterium]|nr:adenylate/guanylate cyclase domain-containing protein [Spirochaetota bacterium]